MRFRRPDRSRVSRDQKSRRSSALFRARSFFTELASPDRRRSAFVEPLEDRSMLAVLLVDPSHFTTISAAMAAANNGDTIQVAAGTYSETVTVDKSVTIEGAQSGVDARIRSGAESIVTGAGNGGNTPFVIGADDVTIDGFTVQDETNTNHFGAGIYIQPGHHGTHV